MGFSKKAAKNQIALYGDEYRTETGNWLPGMDAHKIREVCQCIFAITGEMRNRIYDRAELQFHEIDDWANRIDEIVNKVLIDLKPDSKGYQEPQ